MKFHQLVWYLVLMVIGGKCLPQVENSKPKSEQLPKGMAWEEWHMDHEHQMSKYTPEEFFGLHDKGNKGYFDKHDLLSMYGLTRDEIVGSGDGMGVHDDSEAIDTSIGDRVVKFLIKLLDVDDDTKINKDEYLNFAKKGKGMPDLGLGVGHHSDFESEYDIHHWNEYHKVDDQAIQKVHKEDIEHELLHHEHEIEHEKMLQRGASRNSVLTDDELESRISVKAIPNKYYNGPK
ncbi:nucleobindin SSP120 Ecym_1309 [Eremothecium cymbalariae DBVPG|uniref:EF-hand domain-containing protein n=1 Tax=Eremothecium cymbalariae (strain CBS 270.75 / DBVPG 7215 / KCTC 17166 / NRRL Y-17582) TaxID=931890 RepID=G8JN83_ERECY|nr:hypothetical protein Ecym_1309 [Eremothecium cymbalariae DBVPG\